MIGDSGIIYRMIIYGNIEILLDITNILLSRQMDVDVELSIVDNVDSVSQPRKVICDILPCTG